MDLIMEALKRLYKALGGDAQNVEDCRTNVDALNAISAKYGGASDAILNAEAIDNIAAVADKIGGGNPNRVQVIEGTVNLPWPGIDMVDFWRKLKNGEASAKAVFNIDGILEEGVLFARGRPEDGVYYILGSGAGVKNTPSALSGVLYLNIFWEILPRGTADDEQDIVLVKNAFSVQENTVTNYIYTEDKEVIDFILSVPVTTTIIYHPLPEGQEG